LYDEVLDSFADFAEEKDGWSFGVLDC